MGTSTLLARIIGPVILLAMLYFAAHKKRYSQLVDDFLKNEPLLLIASFMSTIMGLVVIQFHNVWSADWRVLVTLAGWSALLKGVMYQVAPKAMAKFVKHLTSHTVIFPVVLVVALAWGGYLTYVGYLA